MPPTVPPRASLAKIIRPSYTDVLQRERLLRVLDASGAQLPAPFVLVFDNYQEVPGDAPLHAVLHEGIACLPREFRVVILSRAPPPARERIALLGWEDLQLTLEEVEGIQRLRRRRA